MMLDDQMQCEYSKNSGAGMCEDYERQKNLERKNFISVDKKVRSKVNTEMDDHTKVDIFTNELKKYMKVMNELEEQNFGSLLTRLISKCDQNALLFGENTEIVSDGTLEGNQYLPRIHTGKRKSKASSQESEYMKKLRASKVMKKWISWENKVCSEQFMVYIFSILSWFISNFGCLIV